MMLPTCGKNTVTEAHMETRRTLNTTTCLRLRGVERESTIENMFSYNFSLIMVFLTLKYDFLDI